MRADRQTDRHADGNTSHPYSLFSGVPLDGVLPCRRCIMTECTVSGFSIGWVDPNVNWLHIRIDSLSQVERDDDDDETWIYIAHRHKISNALNTLVLGRGRPQGLLQRLGGRSDASITRWWSCWKSARATCPKKRSRLFWIRWETGQQPVVCLTIALVTCLYAESEGFCASPWIEGIKSPSKGFSDWPGFGSIHQHRKNIDSIQPELCINPDTLLPYTIRYDTIPYGRLTCAQKLTRWPA